MHFILGVENRYILKGGKKQYKAKPNQPTETKHKNHRSQPKTYYWIPQHLISMQKTKSSLC